MAFGDRVYYPTAAPVYSPLSAISPISEAHPNAVRRRKRWAGDDIVGSLAPIAAVAAVAGTIACAVGGTTVISSRVVYDPLSAPVGAQAAPTHSALGYSGSDSYTRRDRKLKTVQPSSYVFAIPVDDMGWANLDPPAPKQKRKFVSEQLAAPPQVPAVSASITGTIACAVGQTTVVSSRVVYDQTAGVVFSPVAVPTPSAFGYQTVDGLAKRKPRSLPEAFSLAPVAYVPTPSAFGYQTVEGQSKRKLRSLPEAFSLAPAADVPALFGYQGLDEQAKRKVRPLPDGIEWSIAPPAAPVPTPDAFGYQAVEGRAKRRTPVLSDAEAAFVRRAVPTVSTAVQPDGDPDYWNLPWFNVEGGTFTEKLRDRAVTALEEAAAAAEAAEPAKAKRAARKAAKGLSEYVKTAGALLSDDAISELGETAKQLNYMASQWDRSALLERVSYARMALLAYEAQQQDDEDALIALMVN